MVLTRGGYSGPEKPKRAASAGEADEAELSPSWLHNGTHRLTRSRVVLSEAGFFSYSGLVYVYTL